MAETNGPIDIQNHYYRHLFNGAGFAIIAADCQGMIVNCNRMAEELFGTQRNHLLGRHLSQVESLIRSEALPDALDRVITERETVEFEIEHNVEGAAPKTLAVVISPVLDDARELLGLGVWVRDITNRQRLKEQLAEAEKIASLGTLASGVAHHFNNIIGGVATFVDYALHSDNPQATRRALQMTAEAASRVGQITTSLLTFAEQDMRQFDLSDLTEVILTFGQLVENTLAQKHIKLTLDLQPVPTFAVPGSRMHQILGNLLDNAENAMPKGGTVTITLRERHRSIELIISDTGKGIAKDDLPHIFEPFFTTQGTMRGGDSPSAGLGLSVVHGVVRELGGKIFVRSQQDVGTTFTMRFPLSPSKDFSDSTE